GLRNDGRNTSAAPAGASRPAAAAPAAAPARPAAPAASMLVVSSSINADVATHTYHASVSIRKPTDLTVSGVNVHVTLTDASGTIVRAEDMKVDVLTSGATSVLNLSGELVPGAPVPATVGVNATATSASRP